MSEAATENGTANSAVSVTKASAKPAGTRSGTGSASAALKDFDGRELPIGATMGGDAPITIAVSDLHVSYRVDAAKRKVDASSTLKRLAKRVVKPPPPVYVHALRGCTFIAREGESVGVLGRNGSGKSTLMRAVAGLTQPNKGAVYARTAPTLLGVSAALVSDLPGSRNIILGCLAMGLTEAQANDKYDEIVEMAGLQDSIDRPMKTYSSGMGARLRFSITASVNPRIVLIDEALNTGDEQFKARSGKKMNEIRENAGTVLLASHNLPTIKTYCARSIWVHNGQIVMDGPSRIVAKSYADYVAGRPPYHGTPKAEPSEFNLSPAYSFDLSNVSSGAVPE